MNHVSRIAAVLPLLIVLAGCKGQPCQDTPLPASWNSFGGNAVPPGAHLCRATETKLEMELAGSAKEKMVAMSEHYEKQGWTRKEQRISEDLGVAQFNLKKGDNLLVLGVAPQTQKRSVVQVSVEIRKLPELTLE